MDSIFNKILESHGLLLEGICRGFCKCLILLAGGPGFEPGLTESESESSTWNIKHLSWNFIRKSDALWYGFMRPSAGHIRRPGVSDE